MEQNALASLVWSAHFARQVQPDEPVTPARVTAVHRDRIEALGAAGPCTLTSVLPTGEIAVGD